MIGEKCKSFVKNNSDKILICCLLFLICALSTSINGIVLNDTGWQLKTGEWIVQHKAVPKTVIGSWTSNNRYWLDHEWLYQLIMYLLCGLSFRKAVIVSSIVLCIGVFFWLKLYHFKLGETSYLATVLIMYCLFVFVWNASVQARPLSLSPLFLALTIIGIEKICNNISLKKTWWLIPLQILWTNIHGGEAALGYCLFIVVGITSKVIRICLHGTKLENNRLSFLSSKQENSLVFMGLLMMLSSMISPYGLKQLIYPFKNMKDSYMQKAIVEWYSPDWKSIENIAFGLMPIFFGILVLIFTTKDIDVEKFLFLLVFDYLSIRSVRFNMFSLLINAYVVSCFIERESFNKNYIFPHKAILALSLLIEGIFIFNCCNLKINDVYYDYAFWQKVKPYSEKYNIFNDYSSGSAMYYYGIPTFIDGRYEPFSKELIEDHFTLFTESDSGSKAFKKALRKYKINAVVIQKDKNSALYSYVVNHKWKKIAETKKDKRTDNLYQFWVNKDGN